MIKNITGIQQVGIGVTDFDEAWKWYRKNFGMDIRVFEDEAIAELMLPYTNGKSRTRRAALAINMQGGGGFEIWQHTGKTPEPHRFEIKIGDYGIFSTKIKTYDVRKVYEQLKQNNIEILGSILKDPVGNEQFYVKDPYNNIFQFVNEPFIYKNDNKINGGVYGVTIGISDFEKAKKVYCDILGYNEVIYDKEGNFDDLASLPGGNEKLRRVLLKHPALRTGPFSKIFGPTQIELIIVKSRKAEKIFKDRIWGDLGFIHLCFDIQGMDALRTECENAGYPFTVDSSKSFDMGEAAGHFSYIADPDGTLIEFVETHKLPIIKRLGWYMNLRNRKQGKSLPKWMINTLKWGRVKD
jgi:catechol 2,3-dioxygenase-like lactoylglutathione lyase family enzyme